MRRRGLVKHCSLLGLSLALGMMQAPLLAADAQAAAAKPNVKLILVLGDSLSAEYGIGRGEGWVALLERRLAKNKQAVTVVNASISGDTTSGGRSRLPALLQKHRPSHVLVELGGNDALRGLPLSMTQDNLLAIVGACKAAGAKPIIVGMQVPPNYGRQYGEEFAGLFAKVAKAQSAPLVPFLLQGIAERKDAEAWFQADRIHPLAKAHPQMLDNVWAVLKGQL
ncbi:acyl-CoA thioesterase-1 [Roseateles toxinivorans]|uniref:Acyl-CoA thioesterase-1 n=2 Tax=Roseateles toxinivorans TaxID=270368 RepID=A0A4R6QN88_9BURK|nr:acyl-CoA thioesterase-1 [Roseateles toxinivorans]